MTTLKKYIEEEKKKHPKSYAKFDEEFEEFKLEVLGELIRKKRKEKGLTQSQLAKLIHTKKQAISRLERHPQNVTIATLFKISRALGTTLIKVA